MTDLYNTEAEESLVAAPLLNPDVLYSLTTEKGVTMCAKGECCDEM